MELVILEVPYQVQTGLDGDCGMTQQLAADESYVIYQNMVNGCQLLLSRARDKVHAADSD